MEIINTTPFPFMPIAERAAPDEPMVTFLVKATFDIVVNGPTTQVTIAKTQRPIMPDTPHMDPIGRSLAWPSDMPPWKPNTGFFIVGSFHQPGAVPALSGRAAFAFGPLRKELAFFGPRTARLQPEGTWLVEAEEPMLTVPLRWERSFGGLRDQRNPYGMGIDVDTVNNEQVIHLPQIEHPERRGEPANFAPVPPGLLSRRRKLGTRDQKWALFRAPLLPLDYDPSHANAAPDDQQAGDYPSGAETITLVNLHPTIPRLVFQLPGLRIDLAVLRNTPLGLVPEAVPMVIDTVVPIPDENQLVLLFRGRAPLQGNDHEQELASLEVEMQPTTTDPAANPLPARLLARANALKAAQAAKDAAADAEVQAEITKLLPKAALPPALEALIKTEPDPAKVFAALEQHLTTTLARLQKKYAT